jgi:hypothetical protein
MTLKVHLQRIGWVITFTQADLSEMKKREWIKCKEQLYVFFTEEIHWTFGLNTKMLNNDDIVALGNLISQATPSDDNDLVMDEDCTDQVLALATNDRATWLNALRIEDGRHIQEGVLRFLQSVQSGDDDHDSFVHFDIYELTRAWSDSPDRLGDLAPLAAARLLLYFIAAGVDKSQIQTCPECSTVFLATRQPTADRVNHCSSRCAQKYASKEYRKRQGDKLRAKERERSHRRHVAKQRRKLGPNVKVARRPRRG